MRIVEKGWGREEIWASEPDYCGKNLVFTQEGYCCSMHFHKYKDETWLVQSGEFMLVWIDTTDASEHEMAMLPGDTWRNAPLVPHQLICVNPGTVVEVSTYDDPDDNYRVQPGDSQR